MYFIQLSVSNLKVITVISECIQSCQRHLRAIVTYYIGQYVAYCVAALDIKMSVKCSWFCWAAQGEGRFDLASKFVFTQLRDLKYRGH